MNSPFTKSIATIWQVVIILFLINSISFTQTHKSDLQKLSNDAEVIVIGKVTKSQSVWSDDKSKILTNVTITVDEYLKGKSASKTITITHLGGEIDGVGEIYSHHPIFSVDEDVLLFAKTDLDSKLVVLEGENGKLLINNEREDGVRTIGQNQRLVNIKDQIKNYVVEQ